MTTTTDHEAKTRRYYDKVWNERRLELIDDWVRRDFVGHYGSYPEPIRGIEGFRAMVHDVLTAVPDVRMTVNDTVAADDKVVSRVAMTGTHTGPMLGFAPTGRPIAVEFIAIERYVDGLCAEEWVRSDDLALSRQIGALPTPGSLGERVAMRLHALGAKRMRRKAAA
jgi:predicted ester cyclase